MPYGKKPHEFIKLSQSQLLEQQNNEAQHPIKPFIVKLVSDLQTNNLISALPRTTLNIKQLFTILSTYKRKSLLNLEDINYFLSNLYPEVDINSFTAFKSNYLSKSTLEIFLNPFYNKVLVTSLSINGSSISVRIDQLNTLNYDTYERLSLQEKLTVCESLYIYNCYLRYDFNLEDFCYFTCLRIKFDNLVNELLPTYIENADEFYTIIQNGYISYEPELKVFKTDGQFNNLYLQIKNHLHGQDKLTKEYFKTVLTSCTSEITDQIRNKFDKLRIDDPSEFKKFIHTIPVAKTQKQFVHDVFVNWMLHCMNQWFSANGAVNKYILILQGGQNCGKDNFIKNNFLSPFRNLVAENFTFNTDNKDQIIMLASKLFALDSEMVCTTRNDITQIKKITGQNAVDYRTPYATKSMTYKRNVNFIGLTNNDELFKDESMSGGVRFLIIELTERFKFLKAYDPMHRENESVIAVERVDWSKVWGYVYHLYITDENIIQKTQYIHERMIAISEANRIKNPSEEAVRTYVHRNDNVKYGLSTRQIKDKIIEINNNLSRVIEPVSSKMFSKYLKNLGINSYSKSNVLYYLCEVKNDKVSNNSINPGFNEPIPEEGSLTAIEWIFADSGKLKQLENNESIMDKKLIY